MSNVLKVNDQTTIQSLYDKGWSLRRIAGELGLNRRTVRRYAAKCASQVTAGSEPKCTTEVSPGSAAKCTTQVTAGTEPDEGPPSKPAKSKRRCAAYAQEIEQKSEKGLTAQRIWQDLVQEHGYEGSYQSVKRLVRQLKATQPGRVWRMECQPGEEMQVDFGLGAPIEQAEGKTRRSWVFRSVLSYSRKGYSEAVFHQDTETFLRCIENAIRHFGGVPLLLNLDNLKAAIIKADWYDPEVNPKLADFCRHYGMHVSPCRPATPQHKGKVESGVRYVRNNAIKGRRFAALGQENAFLGQWEQSVADKRIHGTTCKQVAALFEEERPHLQKLPDSLFPCYQEARRTVSRDSYIELRKAFYEAPPEYIGRQVWVRWDSRCVRIFNDRMEQVQMHTVLEPGRFSRVLGAGGMPAPVLASCRWWEQRAELIGEHCGRWAKQAFETRGPEGLRSVMGVCRLVEKHSANALDQACAKALASGLRSYRDIHGLLQSTATQENFAFAESHPLIRDLSIYSQFIQTHQTDQNQPTSHEQPDPQTTSPQTAALGAA